MTALSILDFLSGFVGMLTDSPLFFSAIRVMSISDAPCAIYLAMTLRTDSCRLPEIDFIGKEYVSRIAYGNAGDYFKF